MSLLGIQGRKRKNMIDVPQSYALDQTADPSSLVDNAVIANGVRARRVTEIPPSNPPESSLEIPGNVPVPSPSGRTNEPPYQPAISPMDDAAILSGITKQMSGVDDPGERPREVNPPQNETQRLQRDLEQTRQPAYDRNGRVKSAILNSLIQMGDQANRALSSGRPIDEYALASIAGKGIGGGVSDAVEPWLDEDYKRRTRMAELEEQISKQLKIEAEQARTAQQNANADWLKARPEIEADKTRATNVQRERNAIMANLRMLRGQKLDPSNPTQAALLKRAADAGIEVDPVSWNNAANNQIFWNVTDPDNPTKTVKMGMNKATGQTSIILHDGEEVRPSEQVSIDDRRKQFADRMKLSLENYNLRLRQVAENERHHLETEKASRASQGLTVARIKISAAAAKARAEAFGIDFPDYKEMLADSGVDVTEDK